MDSESQLPLVLEQKSSQEVHKIIELSSDKWRNRENNINLEEQNIF